jgi:putative peptidoglycan lipid II flippase
LSLKQETVKFSLITAVAVAGGFIFHILLARAFGISAQLDCLFVALTLFSWLTVLNMFVTSLYIPVFNELKEADPSQSLVFIDVTLKWTMFLSIVAVCAVFLLDASIFKLLAPGFDSNRLALARQLSHILVFGLVFFSISNTCVLTLNALYRYTVPAAIDLFDPVLNILAIFFLVPRIGIKAIAFSYLVSNAAKMCALLWYLRRMTGWKPTLYFYHPKLKHLFKKSSQMALGGFIWSLRDVLTRNITSRLGEGAVSLYAYAEKIITILIQLLVNPLVKVYYSRVSEWAAKSLWQDIRALFIRTSRVAVSLSLFVASGLAVFLPAALRLLLGGSKFNPQAIIKLSRVFDLLLIYFIIVAFENYLSRIVFALKRVWVVAICAIAGILVLLFTGPYFSSLYSVYGLVLGIILSQTIVSLCYYFFTLPWLRVSSGALVRVFFKPVVIAFVYFEIGRQLCSRITGDFLAILVLLPIWALAYFLTAKVFLKKELRILTAQ